MESVQQMYRIATRAPSNGVQGYYVRNKYVDFRKIKEEKQLQVSKEKLSSSRIGQNSKKKTYLDDIIRKQSLLPGPFTYDPKQYKHKQHQSSKIQSPRRKTIFDEISQIQKKRNFPAAGSYDKIDVSPNKIKFKSDLSKAQICSSIDDSMRKSIQCPGVGQYQTRIVESDPIGPKWVAQSRKKKSISQKAGKWPEAATYNPKPVAYHLFGSTQENDKRKVKSKSHFSKESRFKQSKDKDVPFYNIGSEWGMKDKIHKKDILSRVGSSLSHHSVYY